MKAKESAIDPLSNSFLRTLGELRRGLTVSDASKDLAHLVKEVQRTGMPGELKLTLKILPSAEGEVTIKDDVNAKVPRMPRKATSFYTMEDGTLTRENPQQPEMFKLVEGQEEIAPPVAEQTAVNQ